MIIRSPSHSLGYLYVWEAFECPLSDEFFDYVFGSIKITLGREPLFCSAFCLQYIAVRGKKPSLRQDQFEISNERHTEYPCRE